MKLVSFNVNGLRAAIGKGLLDWLSNCAPDVLCLQEVKAEEQQVDLQPFRDLGYAHVSWLPAQKKGYSGVAVFSKQAPLQVRQGPHPEEGRVLTLDFPAFTLVNAYFPSGTTGDARQQVKYEFLDTMFDYLQQLRTQQPNLLVCGDYNICHRPIDIHNPDRNKNTSGFLPQERAWMDKFFDAGFLDTFRVFVPDAHRYSWWTYRAGARDKNLGWRIDYFAATESMRPMLKGADILEQVRMSDHCPVTLELNI